MAITLASAAGSTQQVIEVTGSYEAVEPGLRFRIGDEILDLSGFQPYPNVGGYRRSGPDRSRWIVVRGIAGSTASEHDAGSTVTSVVPASIAGTDLTRPDPFVEPPTAAVAVGDEPTPVAGTLWLDAEGNLYVRNADNDEWIEMVSTG